MKHRVRFSIDMHDDWDEDLEIASRLRQHICVTTPDGFNVDAEELKTKRTTEHIAYFEVETDYFERLKEAFETSEFTSVATLEDLVEVAGEPCPRCQRLLGEPPATVCRVCQWRNISACAHCQSEVSRLAYRRFAVDVQECPKCHEKVRFRFKTSRDTIAYGNVPDVIVEKATAYS